MTSSPAQRGFYFPGEWHPHQATWLSWPHNPETYPDLNRILPAYLQFVEILSRGERVCINVFDGIMSRKVGELLGAARCCMDNIYLYIHPTDDCWIRDHGPSILIHKSGARLLLDWEFNAWGRKYKPWASDDRIPSLIAEELGLKRVTPGIVLEGGSVEFNGRGTVITTMSCLLNPNRNPGLDKTALERILCDNFSLTNVLWLQGGIVGDDTDGHVDDIVRFVDERTVVAAVETSRCADNWKPLHDNVKALRGMTLEDGKPVSTVEIPMPGPIVHNGIRLPASYTNFYIANGVVIVPVFSQPNDEVALGILQELFPDRAVHAIEASAVVWGLGAFHCLSQQEPASLGPIPGRHE